MSWRDNPEIIWQDDHGDTLSVEGSSIKATEDYTSANVTCARNSVAERVEATERWLAALGLTADNIRELPRPIAVGDRVVNDDGDEGEVLGGPWDYGGDAFVATRYDDFGIYTQLLDILRPTDPDPDPDPDDAGPEWVITRDPRVLADALDAGRAVQYRAVGCGWVETGVSARVFRKAPGGLRRDLVYRYEGPAIEASVVRCTPDNRVCEHGDGVGCCAPVDGYRLDGSECTDLGCTRPVGHHGDCIPCGVGRYPISHNLHLKPEDR